MRTDGLVKEQRHPSDPTGSQRVYRFANYYGASVVCFADADIGGSYGFANRSWELAVILWIGKGGIGDGGFILVYDTPITDDVLGDLSEEDVDRVLEQIKGLPKTRVSA